MYNYKSCSILIKSLICSRLDYCYSLLSSLPSISISKIDRIIRTATRLTFDLSYSYYTTTLHFFPHLNGLLLKIVAY